MSYIESLDCEPEIIESIQEKKRELTITVETQTIISPPVSPEIKSDKIFLVITDEKPMFYCETYEDALSQTYEYYKTKYISDENKEYRIEKYGNSIRVFQWLRYCLLSLDSLVSISKVYQVSKINMLRK